jgi:hypothetical protein
MCDSLRDVPQSRPPSTNDCPREHARIAGFVTKNRQLFSDSWREASAAATAQEQMLMLIAIHREIDFDVEPWHRRAST